MKRASELTEAELTALTHDKVSTLIDYECALAGIPLLPPDPGPEPKKSTPLPDVTGYEIGGVVVLDNDHAARILSAIKSGPIFTDSYINADYTTRYIKPITDGDYSQPKITSKDLHSLEQMIRIEDHLKLQLNEHKAWSVLNDEYDKISEARKEITSEIRDRIFEAHSNICSRNALRAEFERYLVLAENDRRIALRFLESAKNLDKFPELRDEFCPKETE